MAQDGVARNRTRLALITRWAVFLAVSYVICAYYLWAARASGENYQWRNELPGYYNMLARGLAQGQLHLPARVPSEMLALPNPWDPDQNAKWRLHDAVLYKGRYYLYHGVTPAVVVFLPWRLMTGYDLPETFAVAVMLFAGYLLWCGACFRLLKRMGRFPGTFMTAVFAIAIGVCNAAPFVLNRVWVYEIAIVGGYLFLAAGFLALTFSGGRALAAAGVMFGLAVGSRPHLILVGAIVFAALLWRREHWKNLLAFTAAMGAVGCGLAWYNYARFGNPFEFGVRYMLAGSLSHQQIKIRAVTVPAGLYYFLISPPHYSAVFPYVRLVLHWPFHSGHYPFPSGYYLEPVAGAFTLSPFVAFIFFLRRHWIWIAVALSSVAILLFICATGFTTQRYLLDFLPLGVAAAVIAMPRRLWAQSLFAAMVAYSVVAHLAIGLAGPYNDLLFNKPERYLRIARMFKSAPENTVRRDVAFDIEVRASTEKVYPGFREPILTAGFQVSNLRVYLEHTEASPQLVSDASEKTERTDLEYGQTYRIGIRYDPGTRTLTTTVDGQPVFEQKDVTVIIAPAQVTVGRNEFGTGYMFENFTGPIEILRRDVR